MHAVFEHEYKTDEQLKTRCSVEKVTGASCFNEGFNIVNSIIDIIYDSTIIMPWLKSSSNDLEDLRLVVSNKNCGKKYLKNKSHDWKDGAINCDYIVLILGKKVDIAGCVTEMFVKTCYPE